jgi:hypothetical protein
LSSSENADVRALRTRILMRRSEYP